MTQLDGGDAWVVRRLSQRPFKQRAQLPVFHQTARQGLQRESEHALLRFGHGPEHHLTQLQQQCRDENLLGALVIACHGEGTRLSRRMKGSGHAVSDPDVASPFQHLLDQRQRNRQLPNGIVADGPGEVVSRRLGTRGDAGNLTHRLGKNRHPGGFQLLQPAVQIALFALAYLHPTRRFTGHSSSV